MTFFFFWRWLFKHLLNPQNVTCCFAATNKPFIRSPDLSQMANRTYSIDGILFKNHFQSDNIRLSLSCRKWENNTLVDIYIYIFFLVYWLLMCQKCALTQSNSESPYQHVEEWSVCHTQRSAESIPHFCFLEPKSSALNLKDLNVWNIPGAILVDGPQVGGACLGRMNLEVSWD